MKPRVFAAMVKAMLYERRYARSAHSEAKHPCALNEQNCDSEAHTRIPIALLSPSLLAAASGRTSSSRLLRAWRIRTRARTVSGSRQALMRSAVAIKSHRLTQPSAASCPCFCLPSSPLSVPYITATDLLGAGVDTTDFVVGGTCSEQLYGVCEAMYKADLEPEELFEVISQCLLSAVDRDCLSGWGAIVHIITPDGVIERQLKSRKD